MKILIIDDDELSRAALAGMISQHAGVEVVTAGSALAAWGMLEEGLQPDLCFLDIIMPDLDGVGFLEKVRNNPRIAHLRVVFCTGVKNRETVMKAARFKPEGYLLKPYDRTKIFAEIERVERDWKEMQLRGGLEKLRVELALEANLFRQLVTKALERTA